MEIAKIVTRDWPFLKIAGDIGDRQSRAPEVGNSPSLELQGLHPLCLYLGIWALKAKNQQGDMVLFKIQMCGFELTDSEFTHITPVADPDPVF